MDPGSLVLLFHLSNPKSERGNKEAKEMSYLREVGEMRPVLIVIQFPSGLEAPRTTKSLVQTHSTWAEVGPGEGSP